jgi:sialidase-1
MRNALWLAFVFCAIVTFVGILSLFQAEVRCQENPTRQVLYEADKDGYKTCRIPSLVATKKGTLLAFCAARKGDGFDWAPIDVAMRRSTDCGKTWGQMKVIAHKEGSPCDNATPIIDYKTGEVHLLYQTDYARCYWTRSEDDGLTWDEPTDITPVIETYKKNYPWNVLAPGPGHGSQMTNGRLIVPFWLSSGGKRHRPSNVVSVYSDDHGRIWKPGDVVVPDNDDTVVPNETCSIQLADGRVLFNSRNESPLHKRLITYSPDGAANWSAPVFSEDFFEPICQGTLCRYSIRPEQDKNRILFCNPDSRNDPWEGGASTTRSGKVRRRCNLTMRMSYDEGKTWAVSKVIDPAVAGYSDVAVTPNGMIHCLYESGGKGGDMYMTNQIVFVSFTLPWLTDGKDRLAENDKPLNSK